MFVVDLNVLLYAVNSASPFHERARGWLDHSLNGAGTVAFCWTVLLGFVRLSTHPAVFPRPLGVDEAFGVLEVWLSARGAVVIEPGPQHLTVLRQLLDQLQAGGNLSGDAHLAALAVERRIGVCTFDRDFVRLGVEVLVPA
jgi:toxin-antitoxin system PIN domain toxin